MPCDRAGMMWTSASTPSSCSPQTEVARLRSAIFHRAIPTPSANGRREHHPDAGRSCALGSSATPSFLRPYAWAISAVKRDMMNASRTKRGNPRSGYASPPGSPSRRVRPALRKRAGRAAAPSPAERARAPAAHRPRGGGGGVGRAQRADVLARETQSSRGARRRAE